jgi:Uma2 family endonuclease
MGRENALSPHEVMPKQCADRRIVMRANLPLYPHAEHLMSMPALAKRRWTPDELHRFIETHPEPVPRYELVYGELLVTPLPTSLHQRLVFEIAVRLRVYVRQHGLGEVRISPSDLRPIPDALLQPDLYVIPAIDGRRAPLEDPVTRVLIAVEVLSPSSARFDRVIKRRLYQDMGVTEYWLVDPDAQTVERWRPGDARPEILDHEIVWLPKHTAEPFTLDIHALFGEVLD